MSITRDVSIVWLGGATCRVTSPSGKVLLIDCTGAPEGVDSVLLTHAETAFDAVTLGLRGVAAVGPNETARWLAARGVAGARGMNLGGSLDVHGVRVTMVPASHACALPGGAYGGAACGYLIAFGNGFRLYHSGVTNVFGDMRLVGEMYRPDLCLLPIGDTQMMGPFEAAHAVRLLGARKVVPLPCGDVRQPAARLRDHLDELGLHKVQVIELVPGQVLT
jgi:L-ascorbate metabolism protein UlaG (beta-lactamase superfamily)